MDRSEQDDEHLTSAEPGADNHLYLGIGAGGIATMGGMGGTCRGKTKLDCYKNFRREVNRKEIEERHGMFMDAGKGTKQELYRKMLKDPKTGEWVLYYHFHT